MSDFFPLIVDGSGTPAIKEIPSGDVLDLTGVTVKAITVDGVSSFSDGSAAAPSITNTGDTNTGLLFSAADKMQFSSGGVAQFTLEDGAIVPVTDNDIDLGTSSLEFKDAYFDGTVTSDAFAGPLTGNVTGNVSGSAATVTGAAQSSITSLGTLTTLDVSGKVSLGTSNGDADYASGYSVIEIGGSGNIAGNEASNEELFLSGNAYYNSGWKYSNAGAAALVDLQNGRVRIRNAGDGADGGAITWITSLDIQQAGDVNVAKSARITQGALTSSSNAVAWDAKAICNAYHVTTENTTFAAPTNAVEGAIISVELAQGGTARTIAFNTVFEFASSTAPTVTATANKTDIFSFRYNGSVWQEIGRVQNMAQT